MPVHITAEIAAHLEHNDFSLAVRRMLDACYDTAAPQLIRQAIEWSQAYRKQPDAANPTKDWQQLANSLLQQINAATNNTPRPQLLVTAKQLSKTYSSGNFSLQPISLQLQQGAILGVVGENGNGKTTLLRCLAGQLALDNGSIEYTLLQKPDYFAIKNYVVFIPQRIPRWYGLLKDNLHFSASIAGIYGDENILMVDFMLERLNLSKYANLTWNQISSGYRTRFEIARILLQKPQLLILDEPLANLDINAQQTILTDLKYLAKSALQPMGIILSSQQLHEVEKIADDVMLIKNGHCIVNTSSLQNKGVAIEVETTASRDALMQLLTTHQVQLQYNGGFYTITSTAYSAQQIITTLVNGNIPINYFRDITYSTKRYF
ncbi:MAG: ABC transporter ATP-binding protein [Sphingobacteriales bacterium]|nr:MAG: ABC transporter ATP-binding protein [Sphingobacteriales bacterium]